MKKNVQFYMLLCNIRHATEIGPFTCRNVKDSFITGVIIKSDERH